MCASALDSPQPRGPIYHPDTYAPHVPQETCLELGVTPIAHTPLAGGLASAKYARSFARPGRRRERVGAFTAQQLLVFSHIFEDLSAIAEEGSSVGRTESQVALQYVMAKGCVPIPGVNGADQARDVVAALDWELDMDQILMLSEHARTLHSRRKELSWLRRL